MTSHGDYTDEMLEVPPATAGDLLQGIFANLPARRPSLAHLTWEMVTQAFERARLELGRASDDAAGAIGAWAGDERDLDRPLNYNPDEPGIAAYPTMETDTADQGMTLAEILGDDVTELIRQNKLPEPRRSRMRP